MHEEDIYEEVRNKINLKGENKMEFIDQTVDGEKDKFIDYVWGFYSPNSDLYPIYGLTRTKIIEALKVYKKRMLVGCTWGGGDSLDRERVRDIILKNK